MVVIESVAKPVFSLIFDKVHNPLHLLHGTTTERPKVVRTCGAVNTFDLEMRFAPQQRTLFRHVNFKKWSENGVFCTFRLGNVLCATTARTFSTSQLPKVLRPWCVLQILNWKCVSCHNGVLFSTSQLPKVLRTWCVLYILTWKCVWRHDGVHFFRHLNS